MAKSKGRHTLASMAHVIAQLNAISSQIVATAGLAKQEPRVEELDVFYETSLTDGLKFLQDWADALRNAVNAEKLKASRNGTVSVTVSGVSDQPGGSKKSSKKKAPKVSNHE